MSSSPSPSPGPIGDITFGTYLPFFGFTMNTMPYASDKTQSKYQWMRFTSVQNHTVPSFDPSAPAKSADMYPAAYVDPGDPYQSHEWLLRPENDGGII